ncbi:MAG: TolC family protein [Chlorobi bacterium]|nr:TolC family protein [Chlorobiota bacterium]
MKKILIIIITLLTFTVTVKSQDLLNQYLVIAAKNNPGLKAKFNEYLAAMEIGPQVSSLQDMQFAFGYFIRPVETRVGPQKAKLSLSQMFPWFGQLKANRSVADEMANAKYEAFEDAKSKLFYDVKSAYYDLYFTQKAIKITDENLSILNILNEIALIKMEGGLVSAVDQLRVEMEMADLDNQLSLLKDRVIAQTVAFNKLLNVESNREVLFADTLSVPGQMLTREAILDTIRIKNHQLTALDHEYTSYLNKEKASRKLGAPSINIGIDYIFTGKSDNPNLEASLSGKDAIVFPKIGLTVPLYRKKYKAMVNEAIYQQEAVQDRKADKFNVLETLLEKVITDYKDAGRRLVLYREQTRFAFQAMQILRAQYESENTNFEEILRMENRLLKYALELEKARADQNAADAFIYYLMGR